jgi:hypothetical protein
VPSAAKSSYNPEVNDGIPGIDRPLEECHHRSGDIRTVKLVESVKYFDPAACKPVD